MLNDIKIYGLNIAALLLCSSLSFGQTNEEIKVEAPSSSLRVVIYSKNRPVVSGYVILNKGKMVNHGVFTIFDVEGNIIQKITYDKGKIVHVEAFDPELKS
jgi:hypothetical protein